MSIDQRKKMLKQLRNTNYDVFEKTCRELGIEYTFPPLYYRKAHRRFLAKKALCIQVHGQVLLTAAGLPLALGRTGWRGRGVICF